MPIDTASQLNITALTSLVNLGAVGAMAWLFWSRLGDLTDRFLVHLEDSGTKQEKVIEADIEARERLADVIEGLEGSIKKHDELQSKRHEEVMRTLHNLGGKTRG